MENDAISRSAVLDIINDQSYDTAYPSEHDELERLINEIPALDVVPVMHARWDHLVGDYYCTNCDKKLRRSSRTKRPKYCERCGARMDGEEE